MLGGARASEGSVLDVLRPTRWRAPLIISAAADASMA